MRQARALAMAAAVAAVAMLLASGPGSRLGVWPWQTGFSLVKWAFYTGVAAACGALILVLLALLPRWRKGFGIPIAALGIALAAAVPPYVVYKEAVSYPNINDITTDPSDPPGFVALAAERAMTKAGAAYGGMKFAEEQNKAYPDIKPLLLKSNAQDTVRKAIDAARALGWEIVATDATSGRIEAVATTTWFGFKDDVVVRVRPEGAGSRVDIRSVSRVGTGDAGANAKRIREFLARLA